MAKVKLKDFVSKPLLEGLGDLVLSDYKVHTDNDGNVKAVELKYTDGSESDKKEEPAKKSYY